MGNSSPRVLFTPRPRVLGLVELHFDCVEEDAGSHQLVVVHVPMVLQEESHLAGTVQAADGLLQEARRLAGSVQGADGSLFVVTADGVVGGGFRAQAGADDVGVAGDELVDLGLLLEALHFEGVAVEEFPAEGFDGEGLADGPGGAAGDGAEPASPDLPPDLVLPFQPFAHLSLFFVPRYFVTS